MCYVFSILFKETEAWIMKKADVLKIQAFKCDVFTGFSTHFGLRVDQVTNIEVLRR